jgi:hypothetical protein
VRSFRSVARVGLATAVLLLLLAPLGCGFMRPRPPAARPAPRVDAEPTPEPTPQRALTSAERRARWRRKPEAESPAAPPPEPAGPPQQPETGPAGPALEPLDTARRAEVVRLYHEIYLPSLATPVDWRGDLRRCDPGPPSPEATEATRRMVNYFRVMAGLPGDIVFDAGLNAKCRQAAMSFIATPGLSHSLPRSWACYTPEAGEAAMKSNIALGYVGPVAVVKYMEEGWSKNFELAHRQWILYTPTKRMGSGSIAAQNGRYRGANALWVQPETLGPKPAEPSWIAWPPRGYVPYQVVFDYWSVAPHVAGRVDFSRATITMTRRDGDSLRVRKGVSPSPYAPDAALGWIPKGVAFGPGMRDETFEIEVRDILIGGRSHAHRYKVTVIDPGTDWPDGRRPLASRRDVLPQTGEVGG